VEEPLVSTGQPFGYTARRFDAESVLSHYRARMYALRTALQRSLQKGASLPSPVVGSQRFGSAVSPKLNGLYAPK